MLSFLIQCWLHRPINTDTLTMGRFIKKWSVQYFLHILYYIFFTENKEKGGTDRTKMKRGWGREKKEK